MSCNLILPELRQERSRRLWKEVSGYVSHRRLAPALPEPPAVSLHSLKFVIWLVRFWICHFQRVLTCQFNIYKRHASEYCRGVLFIAPTIEFIILC